MNRLERIKKQRKVTEVLYCFVAMIVVATVVFLIVWKQNESNKGYKHGAYNYRMCVEVYGLNEDCK